MAIALCLYSAQEPGAQLRPGDRIALHRIAFSCVSILVLACLNSFGSFEFESERAMLESLSLCALKVCSIHRQEPSGSLGSAHQTCHTRDLMSNAHPRCRRPPALLEGDTKTHLLLLSFLSSPPPRQPGKPSFLALPFRAGRASRLDGYPVPRTGSVAARARASAPGDPRSGR